MVNSFLKYCSYITPITVLKETSKYHELIEVQLYRGEKMLNTKLANYSFGSLHKVFQYAFSHYQIQVDDSDSVLIIGFGAGSVKSILRKELHFKGKIKGVEIDSKIISLAKSHFGLPENNSNFSVIITDAIPFIENNTEKYNLIIVDVFYELSVPSNFLQQQFINKIKNALTDKGMILFNLIGDNHLKMLKTTLIENAFKFKITTITIYGTVNYILLIHN